MLGERTCSNNDEDVKCRRGREASECLCLCEITLRGAARGGEGGGCSVKARVRVWLDGTEVGRVPLGVGG